MENTDWINLVYIVIVIIVFFIQYYQIKKQNNILNYYEKIFSIIKIEEIEKYVKLKEDNIKLDFENKNKTVNQFLQNSKSLNKDSKELLKNVKNLYSDKDIVIAVIELNKDELTESYKIIFQALDNFEDCILKDKVDKQLRDNIMKFDSIRTKMMEGLKKTDIKTQIKDYE